MVKDVHFYNMTFAFVKIENLDDLNVSIQCKPTEYNMDYLNIFAKKNIQINNDLNLI